MFQSTVIRITEGNAHDAIQALPRATRNAIYDRLHALADRVHTSAHTFRRTEFPRLVANALRDRGINAVDVPSFKVTPVR